MRSLIGILIIAFTSLITFSCQSKKPQQNSASKFYTDSLYSESLDEYRKYNVYLPKGFSAEKKYPIIYATDGSKSIEKSFRIRTLDSLIEHKIIKPTIYIGSHSNIKNVDSSGTKGNGDKLYLNYRNFEYVIDQYIEGTHNSELANRFNNHMRYFNDELIPSVEHKFNQKPTKEERYFYGYSNGAGFGISLLNKHPERMGTYLCFSIFGGDIQNSIWENNVDYPKLYVEYGSEEPFFLKLDAEFLQSKYKELNLFSEINKFQGGHDYKIWNKKFVEIISEVLANK